MGSKRTLLGIAVGAGAIAVGATPAFGATQCVTGPTPGGPACDAVHADLQTAVNAAAANDTIAVPPGPFTGASISGKAGLVFRGSRFNVSAPARSGPETIITGELAVGAAGGVRIDGFTFQGTGVSISGATGTNDPQGRGQVSNNIFDGGTVGLSIDSTVSPAGVPYEVPRNVFANQTDAGIRVTNSTELDIRDSALGRNPGVGVSLAGGNANVRIFRNSVRPNTVAGVVLTGSPNTGTQVIGNTIAGVAGTGSVGVRVDAAGVGPGTRIGANRLVANPGGDIVAPDGVAVDATGNWYGQNTGATATEVRGTGINAGGALRLLTSAAPAEIAANSASTINVAMVRPDGQPETAFPPTGVIATTSLGILRDNDTPPAQGASINSGLVAGAGAFQLVPGAAGTATVTVRLDSQGVAVPVRVNAAAGGTAGGGGGAGGAAGAAAVRFRLGVASGRRARAGGRVVFTLRANRVVRGQRVQLQRVVRQRVRVRRGNRTRVVTRVVYRNVARRTVNGRNARFTVRFARAGRNTLRASYRAGRTLRRTNAVVVTIRPRLR